MALRRSCALFLLFLYILNRKNIFVSAFAKSELLFPFGETVSDQSLDKETDDFNSVEVPLTTPIVFYDQVYQSIYVSDLFSLLSMLKA